MRSELLVAALLGLGLTGLGPVGAEAQRQGLLSQELFVPPPTGVNYARDYTRVEDCLAAVDREAETAGWGAPVVADDRTAPAPPALVEAARRCGARFAVDATSGVDLAMLRELMHHAERDSVAEAALARELALLPAGADPIERRKLLIRALAFALREVDPARVAWAERRLGEIDRIGWEARLNRMSGYGQLAGYAAAVYDTTRLDRYVGAALALFDSLPEADRRNPSIVMAHLSMLHFQRLRALARGEAVEPEAMFGARVMAKFMGTTVDSATLAAAASATLPALQGDFWFRRADSAGSRPSRGKFGLVVFVDPECETRCYDRYDLLRTLGERFGDALEVTLVAHTHGFFRNHPPLAPAEEAEALRRYFFEHLKLPGALVVETTRFTRLPDPDRRRVDQAPPNVVAYRPGNLAAGDGYSFGLGALPSQMHRDVAGFLVDRAGRKLMGLDRLGRGHQSLLIEAIAGWLAQP